MTFRDSKIYKEIINSDKTLPIPFYTKTGIIINENNIDFIIEVELKKAEEKMKLVKDNVSIFENIEDKISSHYKSNMNKPYLILEFAYFNKQNIEEGIEIIEKSDNFYQWIIE